MGRKERRNAVRQARLHHSRKPVKANRTTLFVLAGVTAVLFLITVMIR
jgi:hypothetical protein